MMDLVLAFRVDEIRSLLVPGMVSHRAARLLVRVPAAGHYQLLVSAEGDGDHADRPPVPIAIDSEAGDLTSAWTYPDDFEQPRPLAPLTRYRVRLLDGDRVLDEARFRTAPRAREDAPAGWWFGALSCHQPFADDGSLAEGSAAMTEAAARAFAEREAVFALLMGDQMYGDYPPSLSLFDDDYFATVGPEGVTSILDCSRAQVRAIYQRRYRQFFGAAGFARLQGQQATYPILDDHEIVDNLGSNPDHESSAWENVRQGALDAYFDYQAARIQRERTRSFDYGFTWGPAAFHVLDVRARRRTVDDRTEVYGPDQLAQLREALASHVDLPIFCLVTSVPLGFAPEAVTAVAGAVMPDGSDVHERWSHPRCRASRDALLGVLHAHALAHPEQLVLLLGGDVHVGAAYQLRFRDGTTLYQLVSSAISNHESIVQSKAAELAGRLVSCIEPEGLPAIDIEPLPAARGESDRNPFGGLNVGLVKVEDDGERTAVRLLLVSYQDDGTPVVVFESDAITASAAAASARR